jgi:hypothetical protein
MTIDNYCIVNHFEAQPQNFCRGHQNVCVKSGRFFFLRSLQIWLSSVRVLFASLYMCGPFMNVGQGNKNRLSSS